MISNPYTEYPHDNNSILQKRLQTAINFLGEQMNEYKRKTHELANKINNQVVLNPNNINSPIEVDNENSFSVIKQNEMRINKSPRKQLSIRSKGSHNVTLMSDSQGRDLVSQLNPMTDNVTRVFGHVQPGAPIEAVFAVASREVEMNEYSKNDCLVIIGGCNNVANHTFNGETLSVKKILHYIEGVIGIFEGTNLILSTIPYRYDLWEDDPKNVIIKDINNGIRKIVWANSHIQLLDLYLLHRSHQTRHGLHINKRGKRFAAREILKLVGNICQLHKQHTVHEDEVPKSLPGMSSPVSHPPTTSAKFTSGNDTSKVYNGNVIDGNLNETERRNEESGLDLEEFSPSTLPVKPDLAVSSPISSTSFLAESYLVQMNPLK